MNTYIRLGIPVVCCAVLCCVAVKHTQVGSSIGVMIMHSNEIFRVIVESLQLLLFLSLE